MPKPTIVAMPGDGIGKIVLEEAIRLLTAAGFFANYVYGDIGWEYWCAEGNPLPERTLKLLDQHKIGLLGAVTSKPRDEAFSELASELQDKGLVYSSPLVGLRQHFGLDICFRPCRTYIGNPLNFIRRGFGGAIEKPLIDVAIFRQNTEGLYGGVEWTNPPDEVYRALMSHKKFEKNFGWCPREELAISTRIFTKKFVSRIVRAAFEYAKMRGFNKVTVCEKPNVIRETSGLMLKIAQEMSKTDYPEIMVEDVNIDAMMMWLTKNPENYNVIVAGNVFGDILSDGFASLIGGLGFAASAQFGEKGVAVFEPTHGSVPKYADYLQSIVNPIAMFESSILMLEYIDEKETASKIRKAVAEVIAEGKIRTFDMLNMLGRPDVIKKGAATTQQMTDAVISKL